MKKITLLCFSLFMLAACNKRDSGATTDTTWRIGDEMYNGGVKSMRTDEALYVSNPEASSFIYARFSEGRAVTDGEYKVVGGVPASANEISFSVNRNGEDYVSTSSGNPSATVTIVNNKLNILVKNVWMLHLPLKQDSLLLDAMVIEQ